MSKRVAELYLLDIFVAILKIEDTSGKFSEAQSLLYDYNAWDSVIREFEIIGEATKRLIHHGILDDSNRVVVDFRNLLIHNYFGVDCEEVWDVIKSDLPLFRKTIIEKILAIEITLMNELFEIYETQNSYLPFVVQAFKCLAQNQQP
ncbi:DUF86 domain-containing protein [Desulfurispirillum indicum]|uniref:HepT-like ribonuclease domain-containing protein n=1 Tax=Desulfurispirillum indicum TaxID=936456 RepID=UPI001CFC3801|nr:HepT-like ribonuclease domain-containing protein [Desulfurispirillum indicum]UCZ56535.1 DUF86 domain-containing protein [Desulfurispirillum indicum]